jgi:hypothetical protein
MTREMLLQKLSNAKLKKAKSKMVLEAIREGVSERGNHKMEAYKSVIDGLVCVEVYYRGTHISTIAITEVYSAGYGGLIPNVTASDEWAGIYEGTVSTIRQRKEIKAAVNEIFAKLVAEIA